jgi:predicted SnoaL-like aldol condensation-catalyzing enzyme
MKMNNCSSAGISRLWKGMALLALTAGVNHTALAAQYTAQEKANMQMVQDFYAALDEGDAKKNTKVAIVGIAEKYIAPNYKQHMAGGQSGRENFIKMFQNMPAGIGGPPPAGMAPPAAGSKPPPMPPVMEPAKLVALMAEGDKVIRITSRGPMMIWNMFRIENGQLAEHWDPGMGGGAAPAGGPPPGAPPAK